MQVKTFTTYQPKHLPLYGAMLEMTASINDTYAGHTDWFRNTFIPGLKKGDRMYVVAWDDDNTLAGCALIKNTEEEKKICTLFVGPAFRKRGIAKKLLEASLKELGEHPLITVSSRNLDQLTPLLKQYGFHLSASRKGVYGTNDIEYYFNDKKSDLVKDGLIPALRHRMAQLGKR